MPRKRDMVFSVKRPSAVVVKGVLVVGQGFSEDLCRSIESIGFRFVSPAEIRSVSDIPTNIEFSDALLYNPAVLQHGVDSKQARETAVEFDRVRHVLIKAGIHRIVQVGSTESIKAEADRKVRRETTTQNLQNLNNKAVRQVLPPNWFLMRHADLLQLLSVSLNERNFRVTHWRLNDIVRSLKSNERARLLRERNKKPQPG